MSLLDRLFGNPAAAAPLSRMHEPSSQQFPANQDTHTRRELLRVVLRDTLIKHGIPNAWVSAETLPSILPGLEPGLHLRLLVKRWEPRLLAHALAFQTSLLRRVQLFDPLAPQWLHGVSWQLAVAPDTPSGDMPDPKVWTRPATQPMRIPPANTQPFHATEPAELTERAAA